MADEDDKPEVDPDRAAILARRQRFIALALSGLSTTACTPGDNESKSPKSDTRGEVAPPEGQEAGQQPVPQPCLSVPIQPEPPPEPQPQPQPQPQPDPQVCLKIAVPPDDEAETGEAAPESKPAPNVCLRKAAPKPCLKKASPT